jgi:hypothetical protein
MVRNKKLKIDTKRSLKSSFKGDASMLNKSQHSSKSKKSKKSGGLSASMKRVTLKDYKSPGPSE